MAGTGTGDELLISILWKVQFALANSVCDSGPHAGKWRIEPNDNSYLTDAEKTRLEEFLRG
jgi:hypothetical protein